MRRNSSTITSRSLAQPPPPLPRWQPPNGESMSQQELSAKIADSFSQFSSMLTQMNAAKQQAPEQISPITRSWQPQQSSSDKSTDKHPLETENEEVHEFLETLPTDNADLENPRRWQRCVTNSFCRAASNGDLETVQSILHSPRWSLFLDVNAAADRSSGTTPLIYAACFGHVAIVRQLLLAGADVNAQDQKGWTALMWSASKRHNDVFKLLLDHGASDAIQTGQGLTVRDFLHSDNNETLLQPLLTEDTSATDFSNDHERPCQGPIDDAKTPQLIPAKTGCEHSEGHEFYDQKASRPYPDLARGKEQEQQEEFDLAQCEASMRSIHEFIWDACLPDQMFVFSQNDIGHILEVISACKKPLPEAYLPANVVFLCARFAHYYSSRELLHALLKATVAKWTKIIKASTRDMEALAFWVANLCQLLAYLKKDAGLVVATTDHQHTLSELIIQVFVFIVSDARKRLDKLLEMAMLEFEPIQDIEQADFGNHWHRFFRRGRVRRSIGTVQSAERNSQDTLLRSTVSPSSITAVLSSVQSALQSYEVSPVILIQVLAELFQYIAYTMFNHILSNKKYLCRSKALQVRMNISVLEEWIQQHHLPTDLNTHFQPLKQLLQFLQCVSQLNEMTLFKTTIESLDHLNPIQTKRCILGYRYEVSESRLPESIERYVMQSADLYHQTRSSSESLCSLASTGDESRRASISSLSQVLLGSASSLTSDSRRWSLPSEEGSSNRTIMTDTPDSKRLPLRRRTVKSWNDSRTPTADMDDHCCGDAMYEALKQKLNAERQRGQELIPTIPSDWIDRLNK
ncbi:hypothetical protein EC973_006040 [Apophysomyces ossiformis]|uniref:Dilute domain-containing protein n=1 Tax=Apophysomyces ossiformis TaxID=679940 RepID=A0A8H7BTT3_9FUNG|nr:hypothetical protein EC973_006040 [Apophysomyces ossiformis]